MPRTKEFYELSNGEKLICGYEYTYYGPPTPPSETYTHMIIKYDECGNLDSSYGNNGRFKSDNFVSELRISTKDFLLLNDESLLMCGHNFNIYYSDSLNNEYVYTYGPIFLYKITPAGISDPNFITDDIESYFNVVSWTFNTCAEFILTEELNDGKIFCAGSYTEYSDNGIILTKFNSNGSFDSTYHGNGILKIPLNMNGLKILETHRIESDQLLFIGRVDGNYLVSFITNNDGALDLSYGQSGYAIDSSTTLNSFDIFNSKIITEFKNNKLYVGYNDIVTNSSGFVISRENSNNGTGFNVWIKW